MSFQHSTKKKAEREFEFNFFCYFNIYFYIQISPRDLFCFLYKDFKASFFLQNLLKM